MKKKLKVALHVEVEKSLHRKIKRLAFDRDMTMSQLIKELINREIERDKQATSS